MMTEDFRYDPDPGHAGRHAARPEPGHGQAAPTVLTTVAATPMFVDSWVRAYREYGQATVQVAQLGERDPESARRMASASTAVATAWRRIAESGRLPWWISAALDSAAQAFEAQARRSQAFSHSGQEAAR